ncbi:zinc finger BED domain-containing protein DAYSLEEPER [Trifolium repens]|nr:zinc finger BED domain-containing protein DAYSLEEPER [Trifolium repens]
MEPMDVNADLEVLDNKLSTLWNIFEKIGKDQSGVEKAICSYCCSEFSIGKNPISEYVSYFANESVSLSQSSYESSTLSKPSGVGNKTKKSKIAMDLQDFKTWSSNERSTPGKTELELYFEDTPMQLEEENSEDFEVLLYWKLHEKKFPTLSIMARDILSIPITTVASESSFSIGGRVLTKYRSSTLPEHVQMLICTRNWLHGFTEYINDEDECNIVDDCNTAATMTQLE